MKEQKKDNIKRRSSVDLKSSAKSKESIDMVKMKYEIPLSYKIPQNSKNTEQISSILSVMSKQSQFAPNYTLQEVQAHKKEDLSQKHNVSLASYISQTKDKADGDHQKQFDIDPNSRI